VVSWAMYGEAASTFANRRFPISHLLRQRFAFNHARSCVGGFIKSDLENPAACQQLALQEHRRDQRSLTN
jgi:hypothetical protein